jgi:CheY-like chemotaxis protein
LPLNWKEITIPAERLILAIEDDDVAFNRLELAFHKIAPHVRLRWARDKAETVSLLREAAEVGEAQPHLILLKLNLPRRLGFEVLEEIKGDPHSNSIPVVVFNSSSRACKSVGRSH